ncbi:DUF2231 domain-containing protein [Nocardioides sp. CER19]|uniref:DUF2231 domain-containing protein n=1 Tax=Nocardioides sp. CER19 TaxID=3038538 RepID=UPI002447B9CD|nr:DUF2231 domain-containing protein [Nocardioides sp. CER19]MDH2414586.1 DUF2231 domain-containing protein [Nocardioides sp. CER19]
MSHLSTREDNPDVLVRLTQQLEGDASLDSLAEVIRPLADRLVADPERRRLLQGEWLGHALHPLLTDLPIGFWTSANVLDLVGGRAARPAARRLVGLGVACAVPTAITGLAEFAALQVTRDRRTASAHALGNVVALTCYTASWVARRRERWTAGVLLGLAGASAATVGGYLGGHLAAGRRVSTRHPAFRNG